MKKIAILGSTGSIGTSTLSVVHSRPGDFRVIGLSAYRNMRLLARQIKLFRPKLVSVKDEPAIRKLEKLADLSGVKVYTQDQGLAAIAAHAEVQTLVVATSGIISLRPTLSAIERGKTIALANKEPLVMAGEIVMAAVKRCGARMIPVDSEHSAIFQCLHKEEHRALSRIYLTGSGGPFRDFPKDRLNRVTPEMALRHPKWKMGKKITIDSATLMNKGLELIEACRLFGVGPERIEVVIHPEAIIHSMVEFCDRSVLAQLGIPDMRVPIQYALDYPYRRDNAVKSPDFFRIKALRFFKPDNERFPCLNIARQAARAGGTSPGVMNAVNEVAVEAFLDGRIGFNDIPAVIRRVMKKHACITHPTLEQIFSVDEWARKEARLLCYQQ
ncbi:MAG: 1-deoxy-D-xylulose-5-phosphate reductoisomerase [Candidatus Omnitrophica bacterium]|nr:1-deoxy-D-xylulose-5-phosphate reductoisomerase [Candidatus Omnitrophota bacterium]